MILHTLIRPEHLAPEQGCLGCYTRKKGRGTANWLREAGCIDGEAYGLEADAFTPEAMRAAFVEEAAPYLRLPRPVEWLLTLMEEGARWRRDALSREEVVERLAQMLPGSCWS